MLFFVVVFSSSVCCSFAVAVFFYTANEAHQRTVKDREGRDTGFISLFNRGSAFLLRESFTNS